MPRDLPLLQQLQCRDSGFVQSPESQALGGLAQVPLTRSAFLTKIFSYLGRWFETWERPLVAAPQCNASTAIVPCKLFFIMTSLL